MAHSDGRPRDGAPFPRCESGLRKEIPYQSAARLRQARWALGRFDQHLEDGNTATRVVADKPGAFDNPIEAMNIRLALAFLNTQTVVFVDKPLRPVLNRPACTTFCSARYRLKCNLLVPG